MTKKIRLVVVTVAVVACGSEAGQVQFAQELGIDMAVMTQMQSGLAFQDLLVGEGPEAEDGSAVAVHYVGWLADGTMFDSSRDRGEPFRFTVGRGEVIDGWDQGVAGMRVGGKRKLVLPPRLAYGRRGMPPAIPGNATLVFEIELLGLD